MGKLSQKLQRGVLTAEANQEVDRAHIGDSQILASRDLLHFLSTLDDRDLGVWWYGSSIRYLSVLR